MDSRIKAIYKGIEEHSSFFEERKGHLARELKSSKNFVCTPDLKHWTFIKSVGYDGGYHYHGGVAKKHMEKLGFVNVYGLSSVEVKEKMESAFSDWAERIDENWLVNKLERRAEYKKPIELYLHKSLIDGLLASSSLAENNSQKEFEEGFKKEITHEVAHRDSKLVSEAKKKYGTSCFVCDFNFGEVYGTHGEAFIEIHHLFAISEGERVSKVEDVRPVCANCHKMLHRCEKLLSIEELKKIMHK